MTETRRTPLHDEHVALGATLVDFAGWQMPLRYTSDVAEHTAVRTAAGLFDLSHMGEIHVSGPQAGALLDRALVGNLSGLRMLGARYTMICAQDGGIIDDLIVYRLPADEPETDERYLVVANASGHDAVVAALAERSAGFDADVRGVTERYGMVAVQGPAALSIMESYPGLSTAGGLTITDGPPVADLKYYSCALVRFRHPDGTAVDGLLARTGYTGEDGFEIIFPAAFPGPGGAAADDVLAHTLWQTLTTVGAPLGLVPAGLAARDSLRLEAGMPLYGHELDRTTTPYDAGLGRVVRLDKTDAEGNPLPFVGRGPLESRAHAPGARRLVGLQGLGRRAARAGYPVLTSADGPRIGTVTSGAPSPTLGYPIALAYVTPERSAEGTELVVDVRGRPEPVRVVSLPFYSRPRP